MEVFIVSEGQVRHILAAAEAQFKKFATAIILPGYDYFTLRKLFRKRSSKKKPNEHWKIRDEIKKTLSSTLFRNPLQNSSPHRAAILDSPAKDIIFTSAALSAYWFDPSEIERIYFALLDSDGNASEFRKRVDFSWQIHMQEKPIHVFLDSLAEDLLFESQFVPAWDKSCYWQFLRGLDDRTAFKAVINRVIYAARRRRCTQILAFSTYLYLFRRKRWQCELIHDLYSQSRKLPVVSMPVWH